jgi:hypothetical protein
VSPGSLPPGPHLDLLLEALDAEAGGQRALLAGDAATARTMLEAAARRYRASYELAPPASYGRLIGMMKAAVLSGDVADALDDAEFAARELEGVELTPAAGYAAAISALIRGEDVEAAAATRHMRSGDDAFRRAADAIDAIARCDASAYAEAVRAIVASFESREAHLTGVPIADTAIMLESFAAERGIACRPLSPVMPKAAGTAEPGR